MMGSTIIPFNTFITLLFLCFSTGALLPFLTVLFGKHKNLLTYLSLGTAFAGSVVTIWCAIQIWRYSTQKSGIFFFFNPMNSEMPAITFEFSADYLSAFFLLLTGVFTLAVVLHLSVWLEDITDRHRIVAVFNLFVLSIVLTILSNTVYCYLFFQECMTLSFAYLALYRHNTSIEKTNISPKDLESSKSAFKSYLIFEHIGIMLIASALLVLSMQTFSCREDKFDYECVNRFSNGEVGFNFDSFHAFQHHAILDARGDKAGNTNARLTNLIFLLALAGFGIKAGIFPAHVWVPMVHPYSPTSIHAMMSGIALKVAGLYGMYRVFFFFLFPIQWWWGWLVLFLAAATTLFGVFYAILAKDLKTALASHSVENIGIILAGIGLALLFNASNSLQFDLSVRKAGLSAQFPHNYFIGLSGLALIASLYHLVNHSIFKGLLFFCTGAIENRLGVVALDRLGGLMKLYPLTSGAFLIGSVSIAAFPPFNGFISEWLLLQTLFAGMDLYMAKERVFLLVGLVVVLLCLTLAFGLTALAFVKIVGETLLGAPRDPVIAKNARSGEVGWPIRIVLIGFSILCLLFGLFPTMVTQQLDKISMQSISDYQQNYLFVNGNSIVLDIPMINQGKYHNELEVFIEDYFIPKFSYQTRLSPRMIFTIGLSLGFSILISLMTRKIILQKYKKLKIGSPWICGIPFFGRKMQYTGMAFSSLIWKPFASKTGQKFSPNANEPVLGGTVIFSTNSYENDENKENLSYKEFVTTKRSVPEPISRFYNSLVTQLLLLCEKIGIRVQTGDIRVYLLYIFILFITILITLFLIMER